MNLTFSNHRNSVAFFFLLSLIVHSVTVYTLTHFGPYDVTRPLCPAPPVYVDLVPPEQKSLSPETSHPVEAETFSQVGPPVIATEMQTADPDLASGRMGPQLTSSGTETSLIGTAVVPENRGKVFSPAGMDGDQHEESGEELVPRPTMAIVNQRVLKTGDFLSAKREKLMYLISLYGVPVGNATLEAKNERGELRITSTARSNDVISTLYPVDNRTETRVMAGTYILTRIHQQEGTYRSDVGFTICLPQKNVFWINLLNNRVANYPIESDDVLDVVTGFYSLRTRDLAVGSTVVLHLFDSNAFATTPVHVVRRERVVLPGLREVGTLVLQPVLQTDGFFRNMGDVLIWLTDDEYKVPVRMEASIVLGRVTVELVAAEAER